MKQIRKKQFTFSGTYLLLAIGALWLIQSLLFASHKPKEVTYTELIAAIRTGDVQEVVITATEITALLKPTSAASQRRNARRLKATRLPNLDESRLLVLLSEHGVTVRGRIEEVSWWANLLMGWMLPIALFMGIYYLGMRRLSRGGGALSVGRSKAKIYDESQHKRVTFDDVAGVDEARAELMEVVDFLKSPSKYTAVGARVPKGVLLVGPPGTGKTLLARAVAGEAEVAFFSLSGSDFVEMFVGVGAARVRDLFEQAKGHSPCIVFIDEIDAIGKSRGGIAAMGTHDEREQTLNQLLAEMDGFAATEGVVIMAATNRPEVLDSALQRAGRFDRQVVVDRPDVTGREAILKVHARKVPLSEQVPLRLIAQRTSGMVGADLERVVNEAALAAVRRGASRVESTDFEEAIDRIQLGLQKRSRVMSEDEKRRVAFHESGHALVAFSLARVPPVHRVSIIPRSIGALGVTLQLPTEDRYLMTRQELLEQICVMLGGRVAEEQLCNDVSTGAENDLERATETARQMVCRFGMSPKLGPLSYGQTQGSRFLAGPLGLTGEPNYSEETARAIDAELRAVVEVEYARAAKILAARRAVLEEMTRRLLEKETLDRAELEDLVGPPPRVEGSCPWRVVGQAATGNR